eukprot:TRINITY_DN1876_c0_g1_i6.p1 TRINITY_DN1876_c0_g1~~TRINITY_DN1876_c0_g1_i6.p1  ORF type:complete len:867 (+),score=250.05 TRINITY_DN1876_c0_g1_i6:61-2661(+)
MQGDEEVIQETQKMTKKNSFYPTKMSSRQELGDSSSELYRPAFTSRDKLDHEKLWSIMGSYLKNDVQTIQENIVNHIEYTLARTRFNFDNTACYQATAHAVRDRLIESWNDTQQHWTNQDPKRIYYMSLEFLLGRAMQNALTNLKVEGQFKQALLDLGYKLEEIYEEEHDPALGNGGLGRLAACFLDSMATMDLPAWGYGIRYNYGIFAQKIVNGYQLEVPDYWLTYGNPWEIERLDVKYPIRFYGRVHRVNENGKERAIWDGGEIVLAQAYDNPIPGYNTFTTINLRLWRSVPTQEFDFSLFNQADYMKAIEARQRAEYISSVLYPNDSTYSGKELRLKQQYFFVSATLQDIIRRFKKRKRSWKDFPEKVCVQLNDTHPGLAIIELLRILIDIEGLEREQAWSIVGKTFAYTNHTVLPEALEKWGVDLIGSLLPRHLEMIYEVNYFWLEKVGQKFPGDDGKLASLSIIEEGPVKKVRIANLCIVGSSAVNGVAALHSDLLKTTIFKDFHQMFPKKIQNKTNGVTPRRWVLCCNPGLAELYTRVLGSQDWVIELGLVRQIEKKADQAEFQSVWAEIKLENKRRLAKWVQKHCGIKVNEHSLFDVMVKRMHEYKRQLMNALYAIHRYFTIKDARPEERVNFVPRTIFIGGKAAPGYLSAKRVIKLINAIGEVVNNDREVNDYLKVVFLPNYNVSNAEVIIPAAELSQHISTAGMEASGTSNMKFTMNGCLIIGTMDGANVEIAEEAGKENQFIFGATVDQVEGLRKKMRETDPNEYAGPILNRIFRAIEDNVFGAREDLVPLIDTIRNRNDYYLVCHDFEDYLRAQDEVDRAYLNKAEWNRRSILTATRMAKFSSDRTIQELSLIHI